MKWAEVIISITNDDDLTDRELEGIDIATAIAALEEALPALPKGAKWEVSY